MPELVAIATCVGHRGVVESSGEAVPERVLVCRVGWLTTLIREMAAGVVERRWTAADLGVLAGKVSADGRALPSKGWMAVRRLGWAAEPPACVYVSDRVRRAAEEEAARSLRQALHRRGVVAAIVTTWPADPGQRTDLDWKALRAALPAGVGAAEIRNRTRQVRAYLAEHGALPGDLTELEQPAAVAAQALLAAADRQLVTLTRADDRAVLRVQLPTVAQPASRQDWAWHVIEVALPPTVPADAALCTPALRVAGHRVRVDLPFRTAVPDAPATGHTIALGLDWGVNTLLTGAVGQLICQEDGRGRVVSDGRM